MLCIAVRPLSDIDESSRRAGDVQLGWLQHPGHLTSLVGDDALEGLPKGGLDLDTDIEQLAGFKR